MDVERFHGSGTIEAPAGMTAPEVPPTAPVVRLSVPDSAVEAALSVIPERAQNATTVSLLSVEWEVILRAALEAAYPELIKPWREAAEELTDALSKALIQASHQWGRSRLQAAVERLNDLLVQTKPTKEKHGY